MSSHFEYERTLLWGECDPAGIIYFPHYARWMNEGIERLLIDRGLHPGREFAPGFRYGLPAVRSVLEYKTPAVVYDRVVHRVTVEKIGRKSITFRHVVTRDGQTLMEAEDTRVWAQHSTHDGKIESREIPEDVRSVLSR